MLEAYVRKPCDVHASCRLLGLLGVKNAHCLLLLAELVRSLARLVFLHRGALFLQSACKGACMVSWHCSHLLCFGPAGS